MKRNSFIQATIFLFALAIVSGFYFTVNLHSLADTSESFSISKAETVRSIARRLEQNKLISSSLVFQFYIKVMGQAKNIKAGYYLLPSHASVKEIAALITDHRVSADGNFLIKEGETLKEIETHLRQKGILLPDQGLSQWIIQDFFPGHSALFQKAAKHNSLEGYLFPDSYHFPPGLSPLEIVETFLTHFEAKISGSGLAETNSQRSFYDNLIMASILEKEVQTKEDKRMVADILWRRLEEKIPLQVDATICYLQTQTFIDCRLTEKAFQTDSSYNTYLYRGLPPGPICNPGLESLQAAQNPLANQFWYYLTDRKTGKTIFSKTYEQHLQMKQKYI